jgi:hypothetical protein
MHKNTTKCNKTLSKWCKNKDGASKIIDTFETYQQEAAKAVVYLSSLGGVVVLSHEQHKSILANYIHALLCFMISSRHDGFTS